MSKEHIWTAAIVFVMVLAALWASTRLKMNSFDEFEQVQS